MLEATQPNIIGTVQHYSMKHRLRMILAVLATLAICITAFNSSLAQPKSIANAWPQFSLSTDGTLGLVYKWIRNEDGYVLHKTTMFATAKGNTITLFRSQERDPFGGYSRCGGFPCWLEAGSKIGEITLSPRGNEWAIVDASKSASFLKSASCSLLANELGGQELRCRRKNGPYSQDSNRLIEIDSTFSFEDPGT